MEFLGEMRIYKENELSGYLKEKSDREEISKKRIRRVLAEYPKPISPCRQLYLLSQNRYFTHLMSSGSDWNVKKVWWYFWERHDIFTDSKISIFIDFLENFPIFPTSPGRAQTRYFDRLKNITKILVFLLIFFGKFPNISYQSRPRTRIQNLSNFFFKKKQNMLFGNLVMICRQRLCFSAWLKIRGFRVHEI